MDRPTRGRRVGTVHIPAPVEGWDTSSALGEMKPKRAIKLDNLFPRAEYVEIRKGFKGHASLQGEGAQVETLMPYHGIMSDALFAAVGTSVYDVTLDGTNADPVLEDMGNARFEYVNFSNAGGSYLWFCNGIVPPQFYNGLVFDEAEITGIDPASIVDVEGYKGRLWLTLEDDTVVGYLGIEAIQGPAETFELGSIMTEGGVILTIATWSLDGGDGPDDYIVFVTSRGQVIVYGGLDPNDAANWSLIGVYDIGTPIGRRCVLKMGADLAIICVDGIKLLSQVKSVDRAIQIQLSVSKRINQAVIDAARAYNGHFGWEFLTYPRGSRAILNVPIIEGALSHQYVMNTETGAWCRFIGQNASCWAVFQDRLFFGGTGKVLEADVAGSDTESSIVIDMKSSFQSGGSQLLKRYTMAQPLIAADEGINVAIGVDTDFRDGRELRPIPSTPSEVSRWGSFVWGRDPWSQPMTQRRGWIPINGLGQTVALRLRAEIGQSGGTSRWGSFVWGVDPWSASERAETLFQINGFNLTAEQGEIL